MQIPYGLIILVGCLLIGVYVMADYLLPDVICKIIPSVHDSSSLGQYNSHVLSDICSGIPKMI